MWKRVSQGGFICGWIKANATPESKGGKVVLDCCRKMRILNAKLRILRVVARTRIDWN